MFDVYFFFCRSVTMVEHVHALLGSLGQLVKTPSPVPHVSLYVYTVK